MFSIKRILQTLILLLVTSVSLQAQELRVVSFEMLSNDLLARTQERKDLNGDPCAVIRVSVSNTKDYQFEGNVIGETVYNTGEALVYMTKGSRFLTIKSDQFGSLTYEFPEKLEKQVVYRLKLQLVQDEAKKTRTLLMPVMGVGGNMSFGIMVGLVKKYGGYVKAQYDFKTLDSAGECTNDGLVGGQQALFNGQKKGGRLAITAGMLMRLSLPCYLYAGAGYGYNKMLWETCDNKWLENTDKSGNGIELETGFIYRAKNVAFTVGLQTNSFKHVEGTLGVGFMF